MKKIILKAAIICLALCALAASLWFYSNRKPVIKEVQNIDRCANINPDYTDTVIPPNIAPLNFAILESADKYFVKINSAEGKTIDVFSKTGTIKIPPAKWRQLLELNRDRNLSFEIFTQKADGPWHQYKTITNRIAPENIDSYIVYRVMKPVYNWWDSIGVYQRNLESCKEKVVLHGKNFRMDCVNCHSFLNNSGENMFIGIRSGFYGSAAIQAIGTDATKIGAKFGYTAWHPSGKLVVYSMNKVRQFFHNAGGQVRDVIDLDSAICYYVIDRKKVKTAEPFRDVNRLETYPAWSPDGKTLYYCSAEILWKDHKKTPPEKFRDVRYDLMRINYDIETDQWSDAQTVLSSSETGKSILLPRVSPDGKFLVFCMAEYGCFPIYQPTSDLYLMELATGKYRKLDINSDLSESWHSFSSNSRWLAFSSKRQGGLFTRTYLSYIDDKGNAFKPFIMPQKDPCFYDSFLKTYSVPELISTEVTVSHRNLARAVRGDKHIEVNIPISGATPKPSQPYQPELERE